MIKATTSHGLKNPPVYFIGTGVSSHDNKYQIYLGVSEKGKSLSCVFFSLASPCS